MALETPNVMHAAAIAVADLRGADPLAWTLTLASGQGVESVELVTAKGLPVPEAQFWQLTNPIDPALAVAMVRSMLGQSTALVGPLASPSEDFDTLDQGAPGFGQVFTEAALTPDAALRAPVALAIYRIPGG